MLRSPVRCNTAEGAACRKCQCRMRKLWLCACVHTCVCMCVCAHVLAGDGAWRSEGLEDVHANRGCERFRSHQGRGWGVWAEGYVYIFIISKAKRGTPLRDRCVPGLVFTQLVVAFGSSRARTSVALGQAGQSREGPQRSQGCPMTRSSRDPAPCFLIVGLMSL